MQKRFTQSTKETAYSRFLQQIFTPDKKDSFSNEAVFFFIHINFIRYYVSDIAKQIFAAAIKAGNLPASTITIP